MNSLNKLNLYFRSKIKSLEAENLKLQLLKSELDAAQTAMEDSRISKSRMILQDSLDAEKRKLATAEARTLRPLTVA